MQAGAPFDVTPVGSEANHVLRVEKGFLSLGHEVDGTVDPYDLGMGWVMSKKKPDYLGKRSVALRRAGGAVRRELVGVLSTDPNRQIPEGAPLTPGGGRKTDRGDDHRLCLERGSEPMGGAGAAGTRALAPWRNRACPAD